MIKIFFFDDTAFFLMLCLSPAGGELRNGFFIVGRVSQTRRNSDESGKRPYNIHLRHCLAPLEALCLSLMGRAEDDMYCYCYCDTAIAL